MGGGVGWEIGDGSSHQGHNPPPLRSLASVQVTWREISAMACESGYGTNSAVYLYNELPTAHVSSEDGGHLSCEARAVQLSDLLSRLQDLCVCVCVCVCCVCVRARAVYMHACVL